MEIEKLDRFVDKKVNSHKYNRSSLSDGIIQLLKQFELESKLAESDDNPLPPL